MMTSPRNRCPRCRVRTQNLLTAFLALAGTVLAFLPLSCVAVASNEPTKLRGAVAVADDEPTKLRGAVAEPQNGTGSNDGGKVVDIEHIERSLARNLPSKRIIGGSEYKKEWRSLGSVATRDPDSGEYLLGHCTCTLVAPGWCLSAGHCVSNEKRDDYLPYLDAVYLNPVRPFERRNGGAPYQIIPIKKVHEHPEHTLGPASSKDLMLLELQWDAGSTFTDDIKPLADPSYIGTLKHGGLCEIAGFGKTSLDRDDYGSDVLMEGNPPYWEWDECNDKIGRVFPFDKSMICAGGTGRDEVCNGDSGGPLICGNVQVGVVSWGYKCGQAGYPGVYANVADSLDWILETVDKEIMVESAKGLSFSWHYVASTTTTTAAAVEPTPEALNQNQCKDSTERFKYYDERKDRMRYTTCSDMDTRICEYRTKRPKDGNELRGVPLSAECPQTCGTCQ